MLDQVSIVFIPGTILCNIQWGKVYNHSQIFEPSPLNVKKSQYTVRNIPRWEYLILGGVGEVEYSGEGISPPCPYSYSLPKKHSSGRYRHWKNLERFLANRVSSSRASLLTPTLNLNTRTHNLCTSTQNLNLNPRL